MLLIYILIVLFFSLLVYQICFANNSFSIIEGLENADTTTPTTPTTSSEKEYKPYNLNDPNNSLILAQQNAGNIEVLKGRIDSFDGVNQRVNNMQQSIDLMQTQIDGLVQQQADYAQELAGSTPPEITGTDQETSDNVASIEEEEK
jgi:hypothetical protein